LNNLVKLSDRVDAQNKATKLSVFITRLVVGTIRYVQHIISSEG